MYNTIKFNHGDIKMVAHRGCSGLELENTASAFVAAGNRSYWGIETDVHVTSDGKYICFHDDNTTRIAGDTLVMEETTFETLCSLRLNDKDGVRGRRDLVMPTLVDYASICKKYEKVSVLELKNHMDPKNIAEIIDVMRTCGQLENTVFISFDLENMLCIREMLPEQPAQFLSGKWDDKLPELLAEKKLDLDIRYTELTAERVAALHANGITVNVWTCDSLEAAEELKSFGVDQITSNILE